MASKYFKGYKFLKGGKSRPGIIGVKPKSGGVVDEFKSRKLKDMGKRQRKLKFQEKEMGAAIKDAKKKGVARKDLVSGTKVQRDNKRLQREGDKLRKDVLRIGKAKGGKVLPREQKKRPGPRSPGRPGRRGLDPQKPAPKLREQIEKARPKKKPGIPVGGKLKKQGPKPGSSDYVQQHYLLKPGYKKDRKEMKKGGKALKPVDKQKNPGLAKLPTQVRNKMGYMKDGGSVNRKMTKEKFLDKAGASEKEKDFYLRKGGDASDFFKKNKKKFGGGKK
jgi:hypothetical protein